MSLRISSGVCGPLAPYAKALQTGKASNRFSAKDTSTRRWRASQELSCRMYTQVTDQEKDVSNNLHIPEQRATKLRLVKPRLPRYALHDQNGSYIAPACLPSTEYTDVRPIMGSVSPASGIDHRQLYLPYSTMSPMQPREKGPKGL